MSIRSIQTLGLIVGLTVSPVMAAAQAPASSGRDARVLFVDYHPEAVTRIDVRRGFVSRIVLEEGEKIVSAATGLSADCDNKQGQWCVRAEEGTNIIWIKPKAGAARNNLELRTDRRDYSLEFQVLASKPVRNRQGKIIRWTHPDPMYRVIYRYPVKWLAQTADRAVLKSEHPVARNWAYSMQTGTKSEAIAPSLAFDDGRFTYFRFADNRDIPTLYRITPAGEEERLNFHMAGDLVVVQRTAERFVLRLGAAAVGVWNDAYDPSGLPPQYGTTVDGLERDLRGGRHDGTE